MPSASRGSGAVHDALDSIDLRLDLHDLVPWSRRLCPEGRHSTGRRGGAGRRAKLSRVQHNANTGHPSTVAAFAWTEAWPAQPYGHAHDDVFFHCYETPPRPSRTRRRRNRGWLRRLQRRTHPAPAFAWLRSDRRMPTRTVRESGSQTRPAPRGRLQLNKTAPSRKLRSPKWPVHFV